MKNNFVEISTNLTLEDLKRIGFRQIRTKLIFLASITFIFVVFFALSLAVILLSNKNNLPLVSIFPILIPISLFSFVLIALVWAVIRQSKQMSQNIEPTKYIFNEQGMEAESASVSVKTTWTKFLKVTETDTDFLIFTQKNIAIPIPKRFIESDGELDEFRNLIKEKLGGKAKLKN